MRTVRLVITMVSDVVWFMSMSMALWIWLAILSGWGKDPDAYWVAYRAGETTWRNWFYVAHPFISFITPICAFICSWMVSAAVGLPYRYRATKPGLGIRECGNCGAKIVDTWICEKCGDFRYVKIATSLIWLVSFLVTVVFVTYDVVRIIVAGLLMSGGKSSGGSR